MFVKINYHIFRLEVTMRNSLPMHELNSFKKLSAEFGNRGHGECTALVEGCSVRHGNNFVRLSGENRGERDGVIAWSRSPMQVFKQLDLIRTCFIDAFQYNRPLQSVGIRDVSVLRTDRGLAVGPGRCVARMHIPWLKFSS